MSQIFVSYSRDNLTFTRRLVPLLDRAYDVWFDKDLRGGQVWKQEIMERIGACDIFLFLVSTDSLASPYCKEEYDEAVRWSKPILPVLIDGRAKMPDDLSQIQYVDMSASSSVEGQVNITPEDINELHAAIHQILNARPASRSRERRYAPATPRSTARADLKTRPRWWMAIPLVIIALLGALAFVINSGLPLKSGTIAFTTNRDHNSEIYALEGGLAGYVKDLTGSNPYNLTRDRSRDEAPAYSPDGKSLAFVSYADGQPRIYVMNADTSNSPELLTDGLSPAWSPDGMRLAFASSGQGGRDIFIISLDGSEKVNLTNSPADESYPTWSPDGQQIAYQSRLPKPSEVGLPDEWEKWDIYVADVNGDEPRRITNSPEADAADDTQPAWSPDGQLIAFQSNRERIINSDAGEAAVDKNPELYVMPADGSGSPRNITNHTAIDSYPAWSPDGDRLAFVSDRDGNQEIYVMETACLRGGGLCGSPHRLTFSDSVDVYPAWRR